MITLEEIFNLTKSQLKSKLLEYEDKTHYSNNLERINAVIIHSFNKELLNSKEMEIVESENYDRVMKSNPTSYLEFLELLNLKKKSTKINININPKLLKSWNTPKVTTLEGHDYAVLSVSVSGIINTADKFGNIISSQYIISGSSDNTIKIWDLSTYELVETLEGHIDIVNCVVVSGIINTTDEFGNIISKQYIISGSDDETIKIWDISTFKLVKTLKKHTGAVLSVAVSSIINTTDKFANIISSVENTATLPDNIGKQYIISGSGDETIKIWDLSTFKLVKTLKKHTDNVTSVAVSSIINTADEFGNIISKQYIISGSGKETIKIWDLSTFKLVTTLEGHTDWINCVAVSGIINTADNIEKQYIISGSEDKTIKIWDLSTFELVETLEGHNYSVISIAVSGINNIADKFGNIISEQYIISGSSDKTIKIWDLSTFELVTTLEGHTHNVNSVAVSGIINTADKFGNIISKQYIISGSYDRTIKIWEKN